MSPLNLRRGRRALALLSAAASLLLSSAPAATLPSGIDLAGEAGASRGYVAAGGPGYQGATDE